MSKPTVIGKYHVLRPLAQGGMGTLYLASDPVLDRRVAIKVIRAELDDQTKRERFVVEAQSVSRLRHPNVVTIFEYGEFDGQPFIAMEYIDGESVGDLIRRRAPLSLARKLQIMIELCAGMAAAHKAQVVHRDLKPDNIMIDGDGGPVKIVDFGIARSLEPNVSRYTQGIGTPNYMAPEVFMGQMDARSDIYAVGAVCYELLSYQQAFSGDTAFTVMGKIVMETAPPLDQICPGLDPALVAIVNKALEKEPARRYQDLEAMRDDLRRVAASADATATVPLVTPAPAVPPAARFGGPWMAAIVVAAVVAGGFGLRSWVWSRDPAASMPASAASPRARRSVAVIGFKNLSGRPDSAWLSTAFSEMLTTELSAGERLRAIPGENVARMKIELSLADADSFASDTLKRIRRNIGTDLVLVGSYVSIGAPGAERIRLDVRLQDTAAGDTIAVVSDTASEAELLDLVSRTGARVRDRLGVGELSGGEAATVLASLPSTPDATRLYAEGLRRLRVYDNLAAQRYFERALTVDPNAPLTYAALAAAWSALGHDARAEEAASKAFAQSGKLSREDRSSVEGRYREIRHEWDLAVQVYRTLFELFPDNVEYGLRLAASQESAGRAKDALATVDSLRALPAPESEDPRIDLAESSAARFLSDLKRSAAAAERGVRKADAQGARLLKARALLQQGSTLVNVGEFDKGHQLLIEARTIFTDAGDRSAAARTSNLIAQVLARRGDVDTARRTLEQALATYRDIGNVFGVALIQSNLGNVFLLQGNLDEAARQWENALATHRRLNDKEGIARTLNNIGNVYVRRGELAAALERFEAALVLWRELGRRRESAVSLDNLARIQFDRGNLARAKQLSDEALAIYQEVGDKSHSAAELTKIAAILRAQGDLAGARSREEQALAMQEQMGDKMEAASTREALARTAFEEGRLADAEALGRAAADEFRREKLRNSEAAARTLLVSVFLQQGKVDEARAALRTATEVLQKDAGRQSALGVEVARVRVMAASGDLAAAERAIQAAIRDARRLQTTEDELDARVLLGEIQLKAGKTAAARSLLADVEKQANAQGFGLVAKKAAAIRR